MFLVQVNKNQISIRQTEPMTTGSQNVYVMEFRFSDEWTTLEKTVVFQAQLSGSNQETREVNVIYNILLDKSNRCMIPWEVLTTKNANVRFGVFGTMDDNVILPTVWASAGTMLEGVPTNGVSPEPPTPDVYQQLLTRLRKIEDVIENGIDISTDGAIAVFENYSITSLNGFNNVTIPSSVIMRNSNIAVASALRGNAYEEGKYLHFNADVVYLEIQPDPASGENMLVVTDPSGYKYGFPYGADQKFVDMIVIGSNGESPEGVNFTTDDTLTMTRDDVLGVTVPVKGMTQSEYDELTEEEQNKGLVFVGNETLSGQENPRVIFEGRELVIGAGGSSLLYVDWLDSGFNSLSVGQTIYIPLEYVKNPDGHEIEENDCAIAFLSDISDSQYAILAHVPYSVDAYAETRLPLEIDAVLMVAEKEGDEVVPTRLIPYKGSELDISEDGTTRANQSDFNEIPQINDITVAPYKDISGEEDIHYLGVFSFTSSSGDIWTLTVQTQVRLNYGGGDTPGVTYIAGDGISIVNDVISSNTPVLGSTTSSFETDVSEAMKEKSLYFVKDTETGVSRAYFKGSYLNLGIPDYVAGNGIEIDGSVITVECPIIPITQEEYDALSDEQKNSETLWIIVDSEAVIIESDEGDWHIRRHPSKGSDGYYIEMYFHRTISIPVDKWKPSGGFYAADIDDIVNENYPYILSRKLSESFQAASVEYELPVFAVPIFNGSHARMDDHVVLATILPDKSLSVHVDIEVIGYTEEEKT